MYVDNITSDAMVLNNNGKAMQIKVYEDLLKEKDKEIEKLNNIIKKLEVDLRNMYLTFGEFSEEYTENCIKKLKEELKYTIPIVEHNKTITKHLKEIERLNKIINELEKDFERKIQSCTIEAETTTNDFYCRLHIATLKRWLNKIKELKGDDKE